MLDRENLRNRLRVRGWCGVFLQRKLFSDTELCQMSRDPGLGELLFCTLNSCSKPSVVCYGQR